MKKNNQLNLYFEDRTESKKNSNNGRINLVLSCILLFSFIIFLRLLVLGFNKVDFVENQTREDLFFERREVVDTNGIILAKNIIVHDLILRKNKIGNINDLLLKVKINFPSINFSQIKKDLESKKIIILKRNLSQSEYNKAILLGEPALELTKRESRIYPQKNIMAHILGQVDIDNNGISGLEFFLDEEIKDKSKLNIPVTLSIDSRIQFLIRQNLQKGIEDFAAQGAAAILMDANTGKIISMVSLPDFDNNSRENNSSLLLNKNTKSLFELGSVFKTFAIASAIENKVIKKETLFTNLRQRVYCGKYPIDEYRWDKSKLNLTTEEILVKSSNIGTIEIIKKNGLENHQNFLEKLELFEYPTLEVAEVSKSVKNRWGMCNTLTSGYGHGVNTTLIQFSRAFAAIVNGGFLIDTSIIKDKEIVQKKILNNQTSKVMNEILRANVDKKNKTAGSGRNADVEAYQVIGKTGTAEKPSKIEKGYSKEIVNVFASAFPEKNPRYVLSVLIDEPKGAPHIWKHNRRESGWNAVYIAGKIIQNIGPTLATNDRELVRSYQNNINVKKIN